MGRYQTKTTTTAKIQEVNSLNIFNCLNGLNNNDNNINFEYFKCHNGIKKELYQELYKRAYVPFYILLIALTVSFLILNSHINVGYKLNKIKIFLIGASFVVLSEISINFISENNFKNLIVLMLLPTLIVTSYLLFFNKFKLSS